VIQFGIPKREASVKKLRPLELVSAVVTDDPVPAVVTVPFAAGASALGFSEVDGPPEPLGVAAAAIVCVFPTRACSCFAVGAEPTGTAVGASVVGVNGVLGPVGVAKFGFGT